MAAVTPGIDDEKEEHYDPHDKQDKRPWPAFPELLETTGELGKIHSE